ncbi:hypothetical protein QN277_003426 [Acacia crassicarpa]|uniref:Pectinesterase inhibitor domain-containing protein n=1 Tax=Acacia crassicarpa TaxID=499986 RepID=A0AAE1IYC7_9FABA|nr:hypothetical protein QN277_003426 [Acacia crassicarpa]
MKFGFYLLLILSVLKLSTGSDLITDSCRDASKRDPKNINFDFCVASLKGKSPSPPTSLDEVAAMSIQITKSNGTNIVSTISNLLKDSKFSDNAKKFLKDCSDGYSDSLSYLDEAIGSLKSKDFNSANIKVSAALEASVDCEDEFKEGNEKSPLTEENKVYFELNAMSLAFINMLK